MTHSDRHNETKCRADSQRAYSEHKNNRMSVVNMKSSSQTTGVTL